MCGVELFHRTGFRQCVHRFADQAGDGSEHVFFPATLGIADDIDDFAVVEVMDEAVGDLYSGVVIVVTG